MTKLNITINIHHIDIHAGVQHQADPLAGLFAMMATPRRSSDTQPDTPQTTAPTPDDGPVDTAPQSTTPLAPAFVWPNRFDVLSSFESHKNYFSNDGAYDLPEVTEVTDDFFRVRGYFTSKTGEGTRRVTLKVSRSEVESGDVTFTIDQ